MLFRSLIGLTVLLSLITVVAWMSMPPFPAPAKIIDMRPSSIVAMFGPASSGPSEEPVPLRPAKVLTWTKSRGIARWTLEMTWFKAPNSPSDPPDSVSRSVRIPWINVTVPCGLVARARIMVPAS
jgi:hypothetical protein